jgi:hypothetical protein
MFLSEINKTHDAGGEHKYRHNGDQDSLAQDEGK